MATKRKNYIYEGCSVQNMVDGDTFDCIINIETDIDLGFAVYVKHQAFLPQRIRVMDLDTPETFHPRNKAELEHGLAAKKRGAELLSQPFTAQTFKGDEYGRYLGKMTLADGRDYATVMKAEGFQKRENY